MGIHAFRARIQNCSVENNKSDGIQAISSDIDRCAVSSNRGEGIHATGGAVQNCTVFGNKTNGIVANGAVFVSGNQVSDHDGKTGLNNHAGILVLQSENRIEDNNVTANNIGIEVWGDRNIIVRNTACKNTKSYWILNGNRVGTIVVPPITGAIISGHSGGASGTTDPWSNLAY